MSTDNNNVHKPVRQEDGKFAPKSSGNKRGRPIRDLGRSEVPDQFIRDFLVEMSELTTIRNADGSTQEVPFCVALIKMAKAKAAKSNDIRQTNEIIKMYTYVLSANEKKLPNDGKLLSDYESFYLTAKEEQRRVLAREIRRLRKATRRE